MQTPAFAVASLLALAACGGAVTPDDHSTPPADSGAAQDGGPARSPDSSTTPTPTPACGHTNIPCLSEALAWHPDGGFVPSSSRSTLVGCGTYTHSVDNQPPMQPVPTCTQTVLACSPDGLDQSAVDAALADPAVVAAFAHAPILFGQDFRPSDGSVFVIELGAAQIDVGSPCNGVAGCTDPPAGVASLAALLKSLDQSQLSMGVCGQVFHGK